MESRAVHPFKPVMCANLNLSISVCAPSVHWGWMRSVWSWGLDEGLGPPSGASAEGYRSSPTSVFQVTGQDVTNSPNTHTYSAAVCVWCSSEKDTLVEANKKNQQSNPAVQPAALISKYLSQSHRLTSSALTSASHLLALSKPEWVISPIQATVLVLSWETTAL